MQNYQRANSRGNQGHRRRRGTGTYRNEQVSLNSNAYRMRATSAAAGTSRQNATANSQPDRETGWERLRPWVITIGVTSLVTATALFASGVKLSPPFDILPTALLVFLLILMGLLLLVGILSVYHWHADRQVARAIRDPYFDDGEDDRDYFEDGAGGGVAPNRQGGQSTQPQSGKSLGQQPGTALTGATAYANSSLTANGAPASVGGSATAGTVAAGAKFLIDPALRPMQMLMVNPELDPAVSTLEAIEQQYQLRQQLLPGYSNNANTVGVGSDQLLPGERGPQNYYRRQQGEI